MASAPSKTTTVRTVNNKTGVTTSTSTHVVGKSTTVTKTTTIGKAAPVTAAKKTTTAPAKLAAAALGSDWITGPNDSGWNLCAPVAVANALLGATGTEATSAQIETLYRRAGGIGDTGVPLLSALTAARMYGLAGERLKGFRRAALDDADILLLEFDGGLHAAAFAGMTVITWGAEVALEDMEADARIIDAWSLTWHGQELASGR
jgi:hypothetical protein